MPDLDIGNSLGKYKIYMYIKLQLISQLYISLNSPSLWACEGAVSFRHFIVPRRIDKSIHRLAASFRSFRSSLLTLSAIPLPLCPHRWPVSSAQLGRLDLAYAMLSAFMQTHSIRFPFKANSAKARQRRLEQAGSSM